MAQKVTKKADDQKDQEKKAVDKKKTADTKSKAAKKPQTMEELLAQFGDNVVVPQKGDKVTGKIVAITKKNLIIDLGAKTEGVVSDKEFEIAQDYIQELKVGDEIEAHVISAESDRGQIQLSLKKAAIDSKWETFEEAYKNNETVTVKGLEVNKGGLIVVADGIRGFIPSSQFGKDHIGSFMKLKGKNVDVKVIEVDREKNRLIFSERHVSEAEQLAQKDQALEAVKEGEIYSGVVSGVMPFGLFVTVEVPVKGKEETSGFVEGLVHISEISWEKVSHPKDYHKVGDEIKVKVMGIDGQTGKLNLSIKQLSDDPWKKIEEEYPVGTTFTGTVSRVEQFGYFVNVQQGVDGLIHMSKLGSEKPYKKGDQVTVTVESIDAAQRRMSLSPVLQEVPVGYK